MNTSHTTASIGAIILCYSGIGNHIITYQISGGELLNFVVLSRVPDGEGAPYPGKWVTEVSRDEMISLGLDGWEPEVQEMLQVESRTRARALSATQFEVQNPIRWAIHVVDNLPFAQVSGRVALVGDAVDARHASEFHAGSGQTIEDAYILGRLLADSRISLAQVAAVLRINESIQVPFANDVSRRGRDVLMYEFNAPGYSDVTPSEDETKELDRLDKAIHKMWE
ncbi:hypothetical protein C8Q80DRAFT_1269451 [Daedaleopsis nitida]|nr:hypothetical protein C8Q80DRAFT_1269451 [Daedaleopsis nitida]